MLTLSIREKNGEERQLVFDKEEVTIGRASGSDIVLPRNNISKRHARLVDKHDKVVIVDLRSTNGTYVNGRRITAPELLTTEDKVYIGDFVIRLQRASELGRATAPFGLVAPPAMPPMDPRTSHAPTVAVAAPPQHLIDEDAAARAIAALAQVESAPAGARGARPPSLPMGGPTDYADDEESTQALNLADFEGLGEEAPPPPPATPPPPAAAPARARAAAPSPPAPPPAAPSPPAPPPPAPAPAPRASTPAAPEPATKRAREAAPPKAAEPRDAKGQDARRAQATPDPGAVGGATREDDAAVDAWAEWNATVAAVLEGVEDEVGEVPDWDRGVAVTEAWVGRAVAAGQIAADVEREALVLDVVAELVGFGPLVDLLADDDVTRIVVDGPAVIRVWREGVPEPWGRVFSSVASLERIVDRLAVAIGHEPGAAHPIVNGVLANGASVSVVRAPIALDGPLVVIKRPRARAATTRELLQSRVLTAAMLDGLEAAVGARKNILVAGRPGSGRTQVLRAIASLAPLEERLVVIADGREIVTDHTDVARLARAAGALGVADVYACAGRLGGDRIVIDDLDADNVEAFVSLALAGGVPLLAAARDSDPDRLLRRLAMQLEVHGKSGSGDRARALIGEIVDVIAVVDGSSGSPVVASVLEVHGTRDGFTIRVLAQQA